MESSTSNALAAVGLSIGLEQLTGKRPLESVDQNGIHYLSWKSEDLPEVSRRLEALFKRATTPGSVRVEILPALLPLMLKTLLPAFAGALVVGYILGRAGK